MFDVAMRSALAGAPAVTYVDTSPWFCTADGRCPAFVGTTLVRRDAVHLVPAYAQALAPELGRVAGVPQR